MTTETVKGILEEMVGSVVGHSKGVIGVEQARMIQAAITRAVSRLAALRPKPPMGAEVEEAVALNYVADNTYCGRDAEWHFKPGYDPQVVLDALAALAQPKEGWNDFRKELLGLAHQKREEAKRDYRANGKVYAYHDGVAAGLTQAAKMIEAKQPLNLVGSASPTPQEAQAEESGS